jgi:hypothetical protein
VQTAESGSGDKGHAALLQGVLTACRNGTPLRPGIEAAHLAQSVALGALESIASAKGGEVARPPAG